MKCLNKQNHQFEKFCWNCGFEPSQSMSTMSKSAALDVQIKTVAIIFEVCSKLAIPIEFKIPIDK